MSPLERRSLVGREPDLRRLEDLVRVGERLITIVGPPGIGKTRLAEELVRETPPAFFCPLGQARDIEGICRGVASGLAVSLSATGSSVAQLARTMFDRAPCTVVLDNAEQILAPLREALGSWRAFAPEVAFVVTSRERLQLPGEVVHELAPLGLLRRRARTDKGVTGGGTSGRDQGAANVQGGSQGGEPSEALELLLRCVERAGRSYADAGAGDMADLERIAERLEGIPLAIELVAPRIALLGARTVERRLSERSDLLSLSPLRAALEWSWTLLSEREQHALARCSVFVSGFDASAFEAVIGAPADALDLVQALRQKSLLVVSPPPAERFGFAFSVRDLAAEKLDAAGERPSAELAHARWYASWSDDAEENADRATVRRQLSLERENLLVAAERSLALGTPDAIDRALRLATALHSLAWSRGPFDAYESLLDSALGQAESAGIESRVAIWARTARAQARRRLGRRAEALADLESSVAAAERLGDSQLAGRASCRLGVCLLDARRFADGRAVLARALTLTRAARDRLWEAYVLYGIGIVENESGTPERAIDAFERAVRLFDELDARAMLGYAASHLGNALLGRGRLDDARRALDAALAAHQEAENDWFEAVTLCSIATYHLVRAEAAEGDRNAAGGSEAGGSGAGEPGGAESEGERAGAELDLEKALAGYDRALVALRRIGDERSHAVFSAHRALVLEARGDRARARSELAHASDRLRGLGDGRSSASVFAWLAGVEADLDDIGAAERALAEGNAVLAGIEARNAAAILLCAEVRLDLARARAVEAGRLERTSVDHLQRAELRLNEALTRPADDRTSLASLEWAFYDVRLSVERARAALATARGDSSPTTDLTTGSGPAASGVPPPIVLRGTTDENGVEVVGIGVVGRLDPASLAIDPRGRYVIAGGVRHSLARKATLQRLLRRLLEARQSTPGIAVTSEELIELGWPGERIDHAAAMNRLRVAVARLRQLGLEGILVGERGGYLLDPDVIVATEAASTST